MSSDGENGPAIYDEDSDDDKRNSVMSGRASYDVSSVTEEPKVKKQEVKPSQQEENATSEEEVKHLAEEKIQEVEETASHVTNAFSKKDEHNDGSESKQSHYTVLGASQAQPEQGVNLEENLVFQSVKPETIAQEQQDKKDEAEEEKGKEAQQNGNNEPEVVQESKNLAGQIIDQKSVEEPQLESTEGQDKRLVEEKQESKIVEKQASDKQQQVVPEKGNEKKNKKKNKKNKKKQASQLRKESREQENQKEEVVAPVPEAFEKVQSELQVPEEPREKPEQPQAEQQLEQTKKEEEPQVVQAVEQQEQPVNQQPVQIQKQEVKPVEEKLEERSDIEQLAEENIEEVQNKITSESAPQEPVIQEKPQTVERQQPVEERQQPVEEKQQTVEQRQQLVEEKQQSVEQKQQPVEQKQQPSEQIQKSIEKQQPAEEKQEPVIEDRQQVIEEMKQVVEERPQIGEEKHQTLEKPTQIVEEKQQVVVETKPVQEQSLQEKCQNQVQPVNTVGHENVQQNIVAEDDAVEHVEHVVSDQKKEEDKNRSISEKQVVETQREAEKVPEEKVDEKQMVQQNVQVEQKIEKKPESTVNRPNPLTIESPKKSEIKQEKNLSSSPFKQPERLQTSQAQLNSRQIHKSIEHSRNSELPRRQKKASPNGETCKCKIM